jgi:hypothetical protein
MYYSPGQEPKTLRHQRWVSTTTLNPSEIQVYRKRHIRGFKGPCHLHSMCPVSKATGTLPLTTEQPVPLASDVSEHCLPRLRSPHSGDMTHCPGTLWTPKYAASLDLSYPSAHIPHIPLRHFPTSNTRQTHTEDAQSQSWCHTQVVNEGKRRRQAGESQVQGQHGLHFGLEAWFKW